MSYTPKISVVTICYNAEKYIEETILSVLQQDYSNIEYIVIDGASKDATMEIVNKYAAQISVIVSEKDSGIYDAMNKGIARATGDFIIFMNAGDRFYTSSTLGEAVKKSNKAAIFYGEAMYTDDAGKELALMSEIRNRKLPLQLDWKSMQYGMIVSHQAIFVSTKIIEKYDVKYRYSSDIDWLIKAFKKVTASQTQNTRLIIAACRMGGVSQQQHKKSLKERYAILSHHYGSVPNFFNHLWIALKTFGKKRVKY